MNLLLANTGAITSVPEVSINWLAIVVATLATMIIGSLWYAPRLYGDKWMKLVGLKKKDAEKDWQKPMATVIVLSFVQAFILSHFVVYSGYFYPDLNGVVLGLITGFWAFVGFALPLTLGNNIFARRSNELIKIETGYSMISLLIVGAIIGAWL